jgi:PAS domain S-box-containing protein
MDRISELLRNQQIETSKMEAILQSLSDGVLVCDTDGAILSANTAAERILQRGIEELLLGTTLHDVLRDLFGQRVQEMPLDNLLSSPHNSHGEPRIYESTVEVHMRVISLTMGPVLKDSSELLGALLLMHDITREVEADRLKTEFIGAMSHELRTPMTSVKGYTQLLAMGGLGPVNDTQREFLNTIQNNAERMISMINDVLDITKIETGSVDLELRPIHLAEALSGVVAELQQHIETREHSLTMLIPPGLPFVRADTGRLHQVLSNLLSNAIKYTPNEGKISIEAQEVVSGDLPEHVRLNVMRDRRFVQVTVRDNGVGIAEDEIERIFERFYRTENVLKVEAGGTGLGLSLVKPLIELLGGRIWVESVVEEGSSFHFVLPAV